MEWTVFDTWIVVTGALSAMSCALIGNYLVLRRMSMMGDAISHTVLPGLAIAFLVTGSRSGLPMLVGATAVGVLTAYLIQAIFKMGGLDRGAAMGVIFTTFFALGLILIRQAADHVDLDPNCVLYGAIELTPLDTYAAFGLDIPRAAVGGGAALLLNGLFVLGFYKELKITSFDPALATTLGIPAERIHYLLMTSVAATAVVAFESVGSILVIAMLIVPGAAAYLLTDRLPLMLALSLLLAALSAVSGHVGAITIPTWFGFRDTSTAGMMAVASGAFFLLAFLLAPRYGLASRLIGQARLSHRIVRDDILGFLFRLDERRTDASGGVEDRELETALDSRIRVRLALLDLKRRGWARRDGNGGWIATPEGLVQGRNLVRSHRLWESYLLEKMGLGEAAVHDPAHRLEHFTGEELREALARASDDPSRDPHGREIPEMEEDFGS